MQTEHIMESKQGVMSWEDYPGNLLIAIKGQADRELPTTFSVDNFAGLQYVLSTLDEREHEILQLRYSERMTRSEIAVELAISPERVRQIENKACRKLQRLSKWNYIVYGIAGYMKRTATVEYNRGYSVGYKKGYEDGVLDTNRGITNPYASDEVMNLPIESLNLSMRAHNCLRSVPCKSIGDVVRLTAEQIWTIRNLGKISANEIAQAVKAHDIHHSAWEQYLL